MNNVAEEMSHLNKLAKRDPSKRFTQLWHNLTDVKWLAQAWEEIRRNKGSQTPGVNNTVAVDVDLELINRLSQELKAGSYRPSPVRRVLIPKANGKKRPLGISNLEDRIVQQAVRMLLEPIFEADFLSCSHGFRQGLSTHTALRDVAIGYSSTSWIMEGDLEACYDSIPHGLLIKQISRRIADEKVLQLIWRFLKAGYLEEWRYHKTYSGIPQGNIVGPLLCNIFLHQIDDFVVREFAANRNQSRKDEVARHNPEYVKINYKIYTLRRKLREGKGNKETAEKLKKLIQQRNKTPLYDKDKRHPCKVRYTRYGDDFVILVVGNKQETETIRDKVAAKFSEMGLKLNVEKTKLTHWDKPYQFLGYEIRGKLDKRGVGIRAVLTIPQKKFNETVAKITRVCSYHNISEIETMVELTAIFRGWCNYYQYANNCTRVFSKLTGKIWWGYAHHLARRHRLSIKQMLKREKAAGNFGIRYKGKQRRKTFSTNVGKKRWTLDIFSPKRKCIRTIGNQQNWEVDLRPVQPLNWQSGRSLATRVEALERSQGICERCKERKAVHVHHTVPLKRKRTFAARVMSDNSQRYTAVAVCHECHGKAHRRSHKSRSERSVQSAEMR